MTRRPALALLAALLAGCTIVDDLPRAPLPGASDAPGALASVVPASTPSGRPSLTPTRRPSTRPTGNPDDQNPDDQAPTDEETPVPDETEAPSPRRPQAPIGPAPAPDAPLPGNMAALKGGQAAELLPGKTLTVAVYGAAGDGDYTLTLDSFTPDPAVRPETPEAIKEGAPRKPIDEPDWRKLLKQRKATGYAVRPYALRALDDEAVGDTAEFAISNQADTSETDQTCRLAKVTPHGKFWLSADARVDAATLSQLAEAFETRIYPRVREVFGPEAPHGGDGDPHVSYVFAPLSGAAGYFAGSNMVPQLGGAGHGRKVVFIDSENATDVRHTTAVMGHEFEHMVNFSRKSIPLDYQEYEESWVDEGLGDLAKDVCGSGWPDGNPQLADRADTYFHLVPDFQLMVEPKLNPDTSGGYGQSYLFQRYLHDRFGAGITKEIVGEPAVGEAGLSAVIARHGAAFETVFRDWVVANMGAGGLRFDDARFTYRGVDLSQGVDGRRAPQLKPQIETARSVSGHRRFWSVQYHRFVAKTEQPWSLTLQAPAGVRAVAVVADP